MPSRRSPCGPAVVINAFRRAPLVPSFLSYPALDLLPPRFTLEALSQLSSCSYLRHLGYPLWSALLHQVRRRSARTSRFQSCLRPVQSFRRRIFCYLKMKALVISQRGLECRSRMAGMKWLGSWGLERRRVLGLSLINSAYSALRYVRMC